MSKNTAEIRVGRLLEVRLDAGYHSLREVDDLVDLFFSAVWALPAETKHVTVVDWRLCPIMSPDCATYVGEKMVVVNSRTERSASIVPRDAPLNVLQFTRLIRDARNPMRRPFRDDASATTWLSEALTPDERQRLRAFLARA
jgi:hypothetical protein